MDRGGVIAIEFNTADYIRQNNNNPYLQVAIQYTGLHCTVYTVPNTSRGLYVQVSRSAVPMCRSLGLLSLCAGL